MIPTNLQPTDKLNALPSKHIWTMCTLSSIMLFWGILLISTRSIFPQLKRVGRRRCSIPYQSHLQSAENLCTISHGNSPDKNYLPTLKFLFLQTQFTKNCIFALLIKTNGGGLESGSTATWQHAQVIWIQNRIIRSLAQSHALYPNSTKA